MATGGDLRNQLVEDLDVEVLVELPGTMRPLAGLAVRATADDGLQLVLLTDL